MLKMYICGNPEFRVADIIETFAICFAFVDFLPLFSQKEESEFDIKILQFVLIKTNNINLYIYTRRITATGNKLYLYRNKVHKKIVHIIKIII